MAVEMLLHGIHHLGGAMLEEGHDGQSHFANYYQ
jgi:hypothetical protein